MKLRTRAWTLLAALAPAAVHAQQYVSLCDRVGMTEGQEDASAVTTENQVKVAIERLASPQATVAFTVPTPQQLRNLSSGAAGSALSPGNRSAFGAAGSSSPSAPPVHSLPSATILQGKPWAVPRLPQGTAASTSLSGSDSVTRIMADLERTKVRDYASVFGEELVGAIGGGRTVIWPSTSPASARIRMALAILEPRLKQLLQNDTAIIVPGTQGPGPLDPSAPFDGSPLRYDPLRKCYERIAGVTTIGKDGRRAEAFWPNGFREVGLMIRRLSAADRDGNRFQICGFTRVHPEWIVTALHCVARGSGPVTILHDLTPGNAIFLLSRENQTQFALSSCFPDPRRPECPFDHATPHGVPSFPGLPQWQDGIPDEDLAILRIRATPGTPITAPLAWQDPPPTSVVTVAGHGASNVADYSAWKGLQVGWHTAAIAEGRTIRIQTTRGLPESGICAGDSGSPVFAGRFSGLRPESRPLLSVVSAVEIRGRTPTGETCQNAVGRATLLSRHKAWLCEATGKVLGGCR